MDWSIYAILLAACAAAATTGGMFMPGQWYEELEKPDWTPPNWLFPVAWTTLYLLMSLAGARVAATPDPAYALAFWALQIALNTLWTPIFFGLRRMKMALFVIVAMWIAVAGCLITHWQADWIAGLMFVPYLMWVTTAGALNYEVMRRNPDVAPIT